MKRITIAVLILGMSFGSMAQEKEIQREWVTNGISFFTKVLQTENELEKISEKILSNLSQFFPNSVSAIYSADVSSNKLRLCACYSYGKIKYSNQTYSCA